MTVHLEKSERPPHPLRSLARRPRLAVFLAVGLAAAAGWIYLAAMVADMVPAMDMACMGLLPMALRMGIIPGRTIPAMPGMPIMLKTGVLPGMDMGVLPARGLDTAYSTVSLLPSTSWTGGR